VWLVLVFGEPEAPSPPNVASIFSATVKTKDVTGSFYYNADLAAYALTGLSTYFGDYTRFDVTLFVYYGNYFILNNVCRVNPVSTAKFKDLFSWLSDRPYYLGTKIYKGGKVEVWASEPTDDAPYLLYSVGQDPVFFRFPTWGTDSAVTLPVSLDIVEYIPGSFDYSILRPPSQCFGHGFTCEGSVDLVDVYRFHHKGDYNLSDTTVGDALGDVAYICSALLSNYSYSALSHFQILMNTTFGQYAICSNHRCVGQNQNLVGQEASYGVKWNGGQCFSNTDVGNWYSLPHAGLCEDKMQVGAGCSWKIKSKVKTIDLKCLFSYQFVAACGTHSGSPYYSKALQVLLQAFSKCPSIKDELNFS